jgi:hypothetical protein
MALSDYYFLNVIKQASHCIISILYYPTSDPDGRKRFNGQVSNGEPHGLGVLFYNPSDLKGRERYEGQFRFKFLKLQTSEAVFLDRLGTSSFPAKHEV